jgi:hypothetical protein
VSLARWQSFQDPVELNAWQFTHLLKDILARQRELAAAIKSFA